MLFPVILAGLLLLGGAAGLQGAQAWSRRRAQLAAEAAAAEAAARQRAEAEQQRAAAAKAAADARFTAHPHWLISLQRAKLQLRTGRLRLERDRLAAEQDSLAAADAAAPARPALWRKLVGFFCLLVLIPLLFVLSTAQLIPSFHVLANPAVLASATPTPPTAQDVLLGVVMAAIEVGIAFLLARALFHRGQEDASVPADGTLVARVGAWFSSSIGLVITLLVAGVLIAGQYAWSPAHDVRPAQAQLAIAQNQLAQDRANHSPAALIASDRQKIAQISDTLPAVRARDQAMALVVTLGADAAALPALTALEYAADDLRRLRRRRRLAAVAKRVAALEEDLAQIANEITLETQAELARLNQNPDLAIAQPRPALPAATDPADPAPGPAALVSGPADPAPGPAVPAPNPAAPEDALARPLPDATVAPPAHQRAVRAVNPDDLFRAGPAAADATGTSAADPDPADLRPWTDPL